MPSNYLLLIVYAIDFLIFAMLTFGMVRGYFGLPDRARSHHGRNLLLSAGFMFASMGICAAFRFYVRLGWHVTGGFGWMLTDPNGWLWLLMQVLPAGGAILLAYALTVRKRELMEGHE